VEPENGVVVIELEGEEESVVVAIVIDKRQILLP
jgi:hypothetical protein